MSKRKPIRAAYVVLEVDPKRDYKGISLRGFGFPKTQKDEMLERQFRIFDARWTANTNPHITSCVLKITDDDVELVYASEGGKNVKVDPAKQAKVQKALLKEMNAFGRKNCKNWRDWK